MIKQCSICGMEFFKTHGPQKFCSAECSRVSRAASVQKYLNSDKGKAMRQEVKQRCAVKRMHQRRMKQLLEAES